MISQADNLLLQSYYSVSLLVELRNNKFLESQFFKEMNFGAPWIKEGIKAIGVDNQGSLLMTLYAMLVIPKELVFEQHQENIIELQNYLRSKCSVTRNDYQTQADGVDFLRHIRNSVSHARVEFVPNKSVTFIDENPKSKKVIQFEMPLASIGEFLSKLQGIHIKHIKENQYNLETENDA